MAQTVDLMHEEKNRLVKILAEEDLEGQKRAAYPFWFLAVILIVLANVAFFNDPVTGLLLLPLSLATCLIGMMRLGYYKLFRLLHHQHAIIEKMQISQSSASASK